MSGSVSGPSSWLGRILVTTILLTSGASAMKLFPITTSLGINETMLAEEDSGNTTTMRCDDARLRCAYRTGCGHALQHYLTRCASVLQGDVNACPEICQHALIGLMSTDEGKELMRCDCPKDDVLCRLSKQRAEICRASVTQTMNRTRVSCRVATWICNADALCSTALQYYNDYCKRMFRGKKCTKRCRNSIDILRRQEKAAKLNTCFCDGAEEYDCIAIHRNMDELCYNKSAQHHNYHQQLDPEDRDGLGGSYRGAASAGGATGDFRTNTLPANRAVTFTDSPAWRILLFSLVLLLHSVIKEE